MFANAVGDAGDQREAPTAVLDDYGVAVRDVATAGVRQVDP